VIDIFRELILSTSSPATYPTLAVIYRRLEKKTTFGQRFIRDTLTERLGMPFREFYTAFIRMRRKEERLRQEEAVRGNLSIPSLITKSSATR
jgi:hypothetical protein